MNEIANQIVRALFKKNSLEECSRWELEILADKYPYFGVAQLLVSGKLKEENTAAYEKQVQKTSLYFTNPLWLDYILNKKSPPEYTQGDIRSNNGTAEIKTDQSNAAHNETITTEEHQPAVETAVVQEAPPAIEQTQQENTDSNDITAEVKTDQWNSANTEAISTEEHQPAIESVAIQETPPAIEQTQEENTHRSDNTADVKPDQWNSAYNETIITEEHQPAIEAGAIQEAPPAIEQTQEENAHSNDNSTEVKTDQWNSANTEAISTEEHQPAIETGAIQEAPPAIEQTQEENTTGNDTRDINTGEWNAGPVAPIIEPGEQPGEDISETTIEDSPGAFRLKPLNIESLNRHVPLSFEPYHTIDYFASQGIKLSLEEKPKDKFGQQLKSFTQWLKTIKKVPVSQLAKEAENSSDNKVTALAEHSLEDRDVVTETMAEVWAKQGNWGKAIDVYQKLSLQNPSKSSYFASLIEQLKHH